MARARNSVNLKRSEVSNSAQIYGQTPLNVGTSPDILGHVFITPQDQFFIRNHAPTPNLSSQDYTVSINGLVNNPLQLSMADLQERFPVHEVIATLSCAGNRRKELEAVAPIPGETLWQADALGTAQWRGACLSDVLNAAGLAASEGYVAFEGYDRVQKNTGEIPFGASISLEKALSPEVLLAYEMNGEPLSPDHGFPLRLVVPGYIGARSVKWLSRITVQDKPSDNYYQSQAYKLFSPHITAEQADWQSGTTLESLPLNSVICHPQNGQVLPGGLTRIDGYVLSGSTTPIERVELSLDNGRSWTSVALSDTQHPWAWRLWTSWVELSPGTHTLVVRTFDTSGQTQPQSLTDVWNFKGYLNNAWHTITVDVI